MEYVKQILDNTKYYKITYYHNKNLDSSKCVITFGEIDSNLEEMGFGSDLIMSEGLDHIYVAQKKHTQYQFLSAEQFSNTVSEVISNKNVYTYGSSLGGYCALYYGSVISANILAMSPRIPAHPIINKMMGERFKNKGFFHRDIHEEIRTEKKVYIFYDRKNYIDSFYIDFFLKKAYPTAFYHHIEHAGHYPARALLLSGKLKKIALDFFYDRNLIVDLNKEKLLNWHIEIAHERLKRGKFSHAQENIEVLLSSEKASDVAVKNLVESYKNKLAETQNKLKKQHNSKTYPQISKKELSQQKKAVSLSFVGDLILLRDQVLNSYNQNTNSYEFDDMFYYVKRFLKNCDFSMGVLEGPVAGKEYGYSTSVYSDRIPLYLNFPDSFVYAIRRAGFDFVTTAQNHLLDCGIKGAMRTLDILDKAGLSHLGCYRNAAEKEIVPIFKIRDLKVAILTYTKRSNHYTNDFFLKDENKHLTSILVSPKDINFNKVKRDVLDDFDRIKKENPDCIIVLPHMGKQFRHTPDNFQKTWCNIFVEAGADIILCDHPHAVQPFEWRKKPGKSTDILILYCPGNFVNSYTKKNGDASALTQIYLNPKTGKPFALACIPLWAHSFLDENYKPVPIYDVVHNQSLRKTISTYEFDRIKNIHELITKTMLRERLTIDQVQEKYYLFAARANNKSIGYVRNQVAPLKITRIIKCKMIYYLFLTSKSACFIGDSLTEGTKNGGYGWFEPLTSHFKHLKVKTFAKGETASPYFLRHAKAISKIKSDLFVIAIGTNDVRYRDPKRCAMTANEYINNIEKMIDIIRTKNKTSRFIFIAPWTTDDYDPISKLPKTERFSMLGHYRDALKQYADSHGFLYIDPNPLIDSKFKTRNPRTWMKDHIHPNADEGIRLYSWAVIHASPSVFKERTFLKYIALSFFKKIKKLLVKQWGRQMAK